MKHCCQRVGHATIVEDGYNLEVQAKTAIVHIGRADQRDIIVYDQCLRMEHWRAKFMETDTPTRQLLEVRPGCGRHQPGVAAPRHEDLHVHSAHGRSG
jgi:hypothetical protein